MYTLLKKLEKSKFITSYWQDSDIGGKRHYYKLTENGKFQVSTLPSYNSLLQSVLLDEEGLKDSPVEELSFVKTEKQIPSETILPSKEVFSEENIDNSTELNFNISNADILKDESVSIDEQFAQNENVSKFAEKISSPTPPEFTNEKTEKTNILNIDFNIPKVDLNVKYVDYVDFRNSNEAKKSRAITQKLLYQTLATSVSLFVLAIICSLITRVTGRTAFYYIVFISSLLIALFYPLLYLINMEKLRVKYQSQPYQQKTKQKLIVGVIIVLAVLVVGIITSLVGKNHSIGYILSFKNFANIYAPLLLAAVYFLDILFNNLFLSKINK